MPIITCQIIDSITIGGKEFYIVRETNETREHKIPKDQLNRYRIKIGLKYLFDSDFNTKLNRYFLNFYSPIHSFSVGSEYELKLIRTEKKTDAKGKTYSIGIVADENGNEYSVLTHSWQNTDLWKFKTLICKVETILSNSYPRLINIDNRHPIFKIGQDYEFKFIGIKEKHTINGVFEVFELLGLDNCIHEVSMLPGQNFLKPDLKIIKCRITDIRFRLHLSQVDIQDPFFVPFESIESNHELQNKYFLSVTNNKEHYNRNYIQLKDQYNSRSAFWIFTFTNKILPIFLKDNIERQNLNDAKKINSLIIKFENWIINSGIITSIASKITKEKTIERARKELAKSKLYDLVLSKLIADPINFLNDDSFLVEDEKFLDKLTAFTRFSNFPIFDPKVFFLRISSFISKKLELSEKERELLYEIRVWISDNKRILNKDKPNNKFTLVTFQDTNYTFDENEYLYVCWFYIEIYICKSIGENNLLNILCGQLLKYFSKTIIDINLRGQLLKVSYNYFQNFNSSNLEIPFTFSGSVSIRTDYLDSIIPGSSNETVWSEIENSLDEGLILSVRLVRKTESGFEVIFKGLHGFLSLNHVKSKALKRYNFQDCDFQISGICISYSKFFNLFFIEEAPTHDHNQQLVNNLKFEVGKIYNCSVVSIANYGLFVSTICGEGLIHISKIFNERDSSDNLNYYFKVGQLLKAELIEMMDKNKADLSLFAMRAHDPDYYNSLFDKLNIIDYSNLGPPLLDGNSDPYSDISINERANCVEQYAVLQQDLREKIQTLQVAKQFYANAKNAKSYLINIYTSYFEILIELQKALREASLDSLMKIRINALEIKRKINIKTVDTFPDSEKLIFFIDIISLFNEKDESVIESLFQLVKQSNENEELRKIAKIALANNLIVSESQEDRSFVFKNLQLIYNYLENGILSLKESIEDRNRRELEEDLLYWREKIKEEESETLEFKSSFITPILSEATKSRIQILRANESESVKLELRRLTGDLAHKVLVHSALKTLVAFANSSGGTLLIGVDNEKNILGLEKDFLSKTPKLAYPNRDGFGLYFDDMVRNYIGDSFSSLMKRKFLKYPQGDILVVQVQSSPVEIFLLKDKEGRDSEQLFIRDLSSTKELTGSELAKFIKNRNVK